MTTATLSPIRRNHERRAAQAATVEQLIARAHGLLDFIGLERSPSWVSRQARTYAHGPQRFDFNVWLRKRIELNAEERARIAVDPELAKRIAYADPTGEEAVRLAMRGRR